MVATLSTVDADAGDSFSYAITNDPSGFFEIVGDEVRVAAGAAIDYESAASHDITVRVTDSGGATYDEVITLTVDDLIDEAPIDITLTGGSVDENASSGTVVARLSTVDADAGDSFSYAITSDPSGFFEIVGDEVRVAAGAALDYETAASHDITVRVADSGGATYDEVITLTVDDLIDETPTDITLTGGSVDENASSGTVVATLSTVDADAGDSFSYAITNDPSGFFEIVGDEVRVAAGASIDYETATSHDITVRVTDAGGATYDEVITLNVNDLAEIPNDAPSDISVEQAFTDSGEMQVSAADGLDQQLPSVAAVGSTGYVVVYTTFSSYQHDVYSQQYDLTGNPIGGPALVNSTTFSNQLYPAVTSLADGGYVITWASDLQDGDGEGIYGQRFDASGNTVGTEFQINTTTANDQTTPDVTGLSGGGFIVTWRHVNPDSTSDINAQLYDASGTAVGGEFTLGTQITGNQWTGQVAGLDDGGFVATWQNYDAGTSSYEVLGQRYDAKAYPQASGAPKCGDIGHGAI